MRNKECEGCKTFFKTINDIYICKGGINAYRFTGCPCTTCLVKMICVTMCDPWRNYRWMQQVENSQFKSKEINNEE
jgi:hypothetical protein